MVVLINDETKLELEVDRNVRNDVEGVLDYNSELICIRSSPK